MKSKSMLFWSIVLVAIVGAGYFSYQFARRKSQQYAMKQAVELGCADLARQFEEQQDEIAEDIAQLLEKIQDIDMDDLEDDLAGIQEDLEEIHEDLVAKK
jgi:DNA-binding transcriptional MerR regulator